MDPREELRQALARMEELDAGEMTDEQRAEYDTLEARARELTDQLDAEATEAERRARRAELTSRAFHIPQPSILPNGQETHDEEGTGGFRSFGEFMHAVRYRPADSRLEARENVMGTDEAGGFLVPTLYSSQLLEMPTSGIVVRPRATVIPAGEHPDAELKFPALDQTAATGGMYGGVAVTWDDEEDADDIDETDAAFKEVSVQATGVSGFITVSNTLLRNASAAGPLLARLLGNATQNAEDHKCLTGSGSGAPLGITHASATGVAEVNRENAGEIVWEDIVAMVAKLHPDCMGNAVFVANQSALAQLWDLKDAAGDRVYLLGDPSKGIAPTLAGIPVIFTGKVPALGNRGDLSLVDFTYYLVKDGAGLAISMSEHVKFLKNRTVIKVFRSVDGKPWVTAPMVLEDGTTEVSPYVTLDVPVS